MDSVTQLALGATVAHAVVGREAGRKAIFWGAICGTLPDLDVFVPLGDAVRDFTYHRGATHSLFLLAALTPLLAWLICKLHPDAREHRRLWLLAVALALLTHPLLDCFTVYGTQIFWPVSTTPIAWSTVFIIDPAYTLPLVVGLVIALCTRSTTPGKGARATRIALVLSCIYLTWTVGAKWYVDGRAHEGLVAQGVPEAKLVSVPAPFNSVLWRLLAVDEHNYYEGFFSLLDGERLPTFITYPRNRQLLEGIEETWPVQRLQWFTKDFYAVNQVEDAVVLSDLRMGVEPGYVFQFKVGRRVSQRSEAVPVERVPQVRNYSLLSTVWERIFSPNAGIGVGR